MNVREGTVTASPGGKFSLAHLSGGGGSEEVQNQVHTGAVTASSISTPCKKGSRAQNREAGFSVPPFLQGVLILEAVTVPVCT